MELVLVIIAACLAAGVLAFTIIDKYATMRSPKVLTTIIAMILSVPAILLSLYVLITGGFGSTADMWAMGICGLMVGFWFKNPFRALIYE